MRLSFKMERIWEMWTATYLSNMMSVKYYIWLGGTHELRFE